MSGERTGPDSECDNNLPSRLFATDRYPEQTLNIYSQPDYLLQIRHALEGSDELKTILRSPFGGLWDIHYSRCHMSGKLVHGLLGRQLVTKKKYQLWTVFGGQPLRFSLAEFRSVTGLECGDYPDAYDPTELGAEEVPFWERLFGKDYKIKLVDVCDMLQDHGVTSWKKLRLSLILIVDGVLIATQQRKRMVPTPKYVAMLEDLDAFLSFPWGRESFYHTIRCMVPTQAPPLLKKRGRKEAKVEDPVVVLRKQLKQDKVRLQGFPLALQLLAFEAIPVLLAKADKLGDKTTLSDVRFVSFPLHKGIVLEEVLAAENDKNLIVEPMVHGDEEGVDWDDEIRDKKVSCLVKMIGHGHLFTKAMWPGGDTSEPLFVFKPKKPKENVAAKKKRSTPLENVAARRGRSNGNKVRSTQRQTKLDEFLAAEDPRLIIARQSLRIRSLERQLRQRNSITSGKFSARRRRLTQQKAAPSVSSKKRPRAPGSGKKTATPSIPVQQDHGAGNAEGGTEYFGGVGSVPWGGFDCMTGHSDDFVVPNYVGEDNGDTQSGCVYRRGIPSGMLGSTVEGDHTEGSDSHPDCETVKFRTVEGHNSEAGELGKPHCVPTCLTDTATEEVAGAGVPQHNELVVYVSSAAEEACVSVQPASDRFILPEGVSSLDVPTEEEIELGYKFLLTPKRTSTHRLPTVDKALFALFKETLMLRANVVHKCKSKCTFDNKFLLEIAEKGKSVSTEQMEIMTYVVADELFETLYLERATFVTPLFLEILLSKQDAFDVAKNPKLLRWHDALKWIVNAPNAVWLTDVDTVYVPHMLPNQHWIALAINLKLWSVEVLDPNESAVTGRQMKAHLAPILKMLPYLIRKCCPPQVTQTKGYQPMVMVRVKCYYKSRGFGDSGPVAMKLMELHAVGSLDDEMSGITEWKVSELRKQYAMDIYREMVLGIHFPNESF